MLTGWSASLREASACLPSALSAELYGEADLMDSLADESRFDVGRAAKAASYDASAKSRNRGRQTRGGRIVLRCADGCGELVLEEWELQRLGRGLSPELAQFLRPSRTARDCDVVRNLRQALGSNHPASAFLDRCFDHGGFAVGRA